MGAMGDLRREEVPQIAFRLGLGGGRPPRNFEIPWRPPGEDPVDAMVDLRREEVSQVLSAPAREEVGLGGTVGSLADRLAGDVRDVRTGDPEIGELALRQAAQLVAGLAIAAPVVVRAKNVHDAPRFLNRLKRARCAAAVCFDDH